LPVKLSFSKQN